MCISPKSLFDNFIHVYFDRIHFLPSASMPIPLFLELLFPNTIPLSTFFPIWHSSLLLTTGFNLDCLQVYVCRVIYWPLGKLLVATILKKCDGLSLSHHWLPVAPQG